MYTDLLLLFVILCFAVAGYLRGFFDQAISLITLLIIVFLSPQLTQILKEQITWTWVQEAPAFVLWCLGAALILGFGLCLRYLMAFTKRAPVLRPMDRWAGLSLGSLKALILLFVGLISFQALPVEIRERFSDLNEDMSESYLVSASQNVFEWDSVSLVSQLKRIQRLLEESPQKLEKGTPWEWGFGKDTDI